MQLLRAAGWVLQAQLGVQVMQLRLARQQEAAQARLGRLPALPQGSASTEGS